MSFDIWVLWAAALLIAFLFLQAVGESLLTKAEAQKAIAEAIAERIEAEDFDHTSQRGG